MTKSLKPSARVSDTRCTARHAPETRYGCQAREDTSDMTNKTLKNKADKLFSEFIRRKGYCEWCNKRPPQVQLQCAHIFSRRYLITRWEPINAVCLCASCHMRWHQQPVEGVEWIKEYLGEDIYNEVRTKAKTQVKKIFFKDIVEEIKNYKHIEEAQ